MVGALKISANGLSSVLKNPFNPKVVSFTKLGGNSFLAAQMDVLPEFFPSQFPIIEHPKKTVRIKNIDYSGEDVCKNHNSMKIAARCQQAEQEKATEKLYFDHLTAELPHAKGPVRPSLFTVLKADIKTDARLLKRAELGALQNEYQNNSKTYGGLVGASLSAIIAMGPALAVKNPLIGLGCIAGGAIIGGVTGYILGSLPYNFYQTSEAFKTGYVDSYNNRLLAIDHARNVDLEKIIATEK